MRDDNRVLEGLGQGSPGDPFGAFMERILQGSTLRRQFASTLAESAEQAALLGFGAVELELEGLVGLLLDFEHALRQ
jgi:hypothetical protein